MPAILRQGAAATGRRGRESVCDMAMRALIGQVRCRFWGMGHRLPWDNGRGLGLTTRLSSRLHTVLETRLPEQRLFLRSDSGTRFVRLRSGTQALILAGSAVVVAWTIIATAILMMDSIGAKDGREAARRAQLAYETRLDRLSRERDTRAEEATAAQQRFAVALEQVSVMQSALLDSEQRRRELETGIGVIQATLNRTMGERDDALAQTAAPGEAAATETAPGLRPEDVTASLDFLSTALERTAAERDAMEGAAEAAKAEAADIAYEMRLLEERHDEIFTHLEEAVTVSMEPLDQMFSSAGLDPDDLLAQVRRGYSGQGGPLGPLLPATVSSRGAAIAGDDGAERAMRILEGFDRMNMYRIAVEKTPLAFPLKTAYRYTSGYGRRWGRMHEGIDLAGAHGSPIYVTADGTVTHAGWENGYGNMVEVRHDFGITTRYGHLSGIGVEVGQKVSRGDKIGAMGNTGRSTGTHLHYEIRLGGSSTNPMTFIKAASNVF